MKLVRDLVDIVSHNAQVNDMLSRLRIITANLRGYSEGLGACGCWNGIAVQFGNCTGIAHSFLI